MTRSTFTMRAAALASATIVLAASACSTSGEASTSDSAASSASASADSTSASKSAGAEPQGAKNAGIDPKNPPKAIAEAICPNTAEGRATQTKVELVEFRKRDKVLLATFRVTPEGSSKDLSLWSACDWDPNLLDLKNLKKYKWVPALTSAPLTKVTVGEPNYVFAGFAVPEGNGPVDLSINSVSVAMENVTWQ